VKYFFDGPDIDSTGSRVKVMALGNVEAVKVGGKVIVAMPIA
jgi:hypothetical protein